MQKGISEIRSKTKKPVVGMSFEELTKILAKISYKDWKFRVLKKGDGYLVQAFFNAPCTVNGGESTVQPTRKWYVSRWACESEVVRTVFKLVSAAELHEREENFKYMDAVIFDPHRDVKELAKLNKLDVRKPKTKEGKNEHKEA